MRTILISDTHGLHRKLSLPKGDLIIHAGDLTNSGKRAEVEDFLAWFADLDYEYRLFIGGNHDFFLAEHPSVLSAILPAGVTYLHHQSIQIGSYTFWGSAACPNMPNWAFGKTVADMQKHWEQIPDHVDFLVTHTPPYGILDRSSQGYALGCRALLRKLATLAVRYHVFGHIHNSYGRKTLHRTTFINASNLNTYAGLINAPVVLEL